MKTLIVGTLAAASLFLSGCAQREGAFLPKNTTKHDYENTSNFVLMDRYVQRSVTSSGIQQRTLEDGRLQVVANLRNRETRRIEVQVSCVFKDEQNFSTSDETPWKTVILTENAQEAVEFTSMNNKARGYTIRVRQAH